MTRGTKPTLLTAMLATGLLAAATLTAPAHAVEILAQYNFGPDIAGGTFSPTQQAADVSATAVTANPSDLTIEFTASSVSGAALRIVGTASTTGSNATERENNAIAANRYAQFSLTPDAGFTLDLANLTFDVRAGGTSTPRGYAIYVSTNGFTTSTRLGGEENPGTTYVPRDFSIGLTGIASTTTFRIYHWAGATDRDIRIDNLTINGEVIPEPASLALMGLGGLLMLGRGRRG